jgi:hypothetical protein
MNTTEISSFNLIRKYYLKIFLNPLLPNDPCMGCAFEFFKFVERPTNCSPKVCRIWRNLVFTPIACTIDVCLAAGPLKVRASLWKQNGPPLTPKLLQQPLFVCQDIATVLLSHLTNTFPDSPFFYRLHWNRECVQYLHWPMKRAVILDQKGFQWRILERIFQTKRIQKIDVYSYRRADRRAYCSGGAFSSGCGAVACNIHPSIY